MHVGVYICMCSCVSICLYTHVYVYENICLCTCMCMYFCWPGVGPPCFSSSVAQCSCDAPQAATSISWATRAWQRSEIAMENTSSSTTTRAWRTPCTRSITTPTGPVVYGQPFFVSRVSGEHQPKAGKHKNRSKCNQWRTSIKSRPMPKPGITNKVPAAKLEPKATKGQDLSNILHKYTCTCKHKCVCVCVYVCLYVYMYVYMCVCLYIYIYIGCCMCMRFYL